MERFGLKNIAMMGLAAVMAVSDLSVSVFAEDIPMHSEVNTTLATPENPVTYIDETTGATVTIYDPDIEVVFPDIMTYSGTVLSGSLFVPMGSLTQKGEVTDSFVAPANGTVYFTLEYHTEYNVSLNSVTSFGGNNTVAVIENNHPNTPVAFINKATKDKEYFFRLSSWKDDGNADYEAYM